MEQTASTNAMRNFVMLAALLCLAGLFRRVRFERRAGRSRFFSTTLTGNARSGDFRRSSGKRNWPRLRDSTQR